MIRSIEQLNREIFGGALAPEVVELMQGIDQERSEVREFVDRMFRLMQRAGLDARDFSRLLGWEIGSILPKILPGAWGGSVPPITLEGRHALIDRYMGCNRWTALSAGSKFLDLGCGFPPLTTVDTAQMFPDVQVLGADPSFGRYMVYDANGNYASFDKNRDLLYFQAGVLDAAVWDELHADPEATRDRFGSLLKSLLAEMDTSDGESLASVERDGARLVHNPVLQYEADNLSFTEQGIGNVDTTGFAMVRCFNVLVYFDRAFRQRTLDWLPSVLEQGGLFLTGMDWTRSSQARYAVYRLENGGMAAKEFAFSIDQVRPLELVAWFALHDDDYDTAVLSQLIATIRSDREFTSKFDRRMDELLESTSLCPRGEDGYLGGPPEDAEQNLLETAVETIGTTLVSEGYVERVVAVLQNAGIDAWRNCVGHVAVNPNGLDA